MQQYFLEVRLSSGEEHYSTFLLDVFRCSLSNFRLLGPDEGIPSLKGLQDTRSQFGCRYVFTSKTDRGSHMILAHLEQRRAQMAQLRFQSVKQPKNYRCQFVVDGKLCGKWCISFRRTMKYKGTVNIEVDQRKTDNYLFENVDSVFF